MPSIHVRSALFLLAFCFLAVGCAARRPAANTPVVDVHEMDMSMLEGNNRHRDTILQVPAGTRIPISLTANTPFCHTESVGAPPELVFDRTTYVYLPLSGSGDMLFSYDRRNWREFGDLDGNLKFALVRQGAQAPTAMISLNADDGKAPTTRVAQR